MQDKIIILKNTKNGIVKDTIVSVQDTIRLNLENLVKLQKPDEDLVVHTIAEPLSGIELFGIWVGAILAIVTIIYTLIQLNKLLKNDNELQSQINELVKLNNLFERRLRMSVKPRLWSNGSGMNRIKQDFYIQFDNRGQIAYYTGCEILEGEENISKIENWNQDIPILTNDYIRLPGISKIDPQALYFRIKIFYYDMEKYEYETVIEWNKGKVRFLETIEL
ncbi:MAG: hypothetical protein AB8B52_02365 [Winogradskyella sp.]|uniref:hypothetical protein n=1 Tax=Winogradskyella sp. TaxID=1883156 RepID=UPI0038581F2E